MSTDKLIPNSVPDKYKDKLIRFIETTGGIFACLYYKPLLARIVDPKSFTTMYIVNLENGEISQPRKGTLKTPEGNLTLDNFFETVARLRDEAILGI